MGIMLGKMFACTSAFLTLLMMLAGLAQALPPSQITDELDTTKAGRPDVSGDLIVWKDNRNGNWDIYMYDIGGGGESPVSTEPHYQNLPVTNGFVIVWQDDRNGTWDLYMKDIILGFEQPLVTGAGNQGIPDIDGNRVTYVDDSSGNNDIFVIDLVSREIDAVCTDAANQWQPRISGDKVAWQDYRNGNWDIYMKDLDSDGGDGERVNTSAGDNTTVDISGNNVVWQNVQQNAGVSQYDILTKDISGGGEEAITADAAFQGSPRVSGDLVAWEDYRNGNYDIYVRDLTTDQERALATGGSIQARPAVNNDTVVWEQSPGADVYHIWMARGDFFPPLISLLNPADGSETGCVAPLISALINDNRSGVDPSSLYLELDGNDVTAEAVVDADSLSFQPGTLDDGAHTVSMSIDDIDGNTASRDWAFTTSSPQLSLPYFHAFWDSPEDYSDRLLSIAFSLENYATAAQASSTRFLATQDTAGVQAIQPLPVVGDIAAGSSGQGVVKYLIPAGVNNFKTTLYVSCQDDCSATHYFPGPPPGS